jgi:hypothetical protein
LYQHAEFIDPHGAVYVLYECQRNGFPPHSPFFERWDEVSKDIREYFDYSDGNIYFLSSVISHQRNASELRALAKEDAALQASLWLGSSLSFQQQQYSKESGVDENTAKMDFLKLTMECKTSYAVAQNLQEEGYTIEQRENSLRCIALYSLKRDAAVNMPLKVNEQQNFAFYLEAAEDQGQFSGKKSVSFPEHEYSGEIRRAGALDRGRIPDWYKHPPKYGDALIGIGAAGDDWNLEAQKYKAQGNAVINLSYQIEATARSDFQKSSQESRDTVLNYFQSIDRSLTEQTLSGLLKIREAQAEGTNYQFWLIPLEIVDKARQKAFENTEKQ